VSNINRNPAGILELLNLNLQGEFPRKLAEQVQPVITMDNYFHEGIGLRGAQVSVAGLAAPGATIQIDIPDGETWAVRSISMRALNADPANTVAWSIQHVLPSGQWGDLLAAPGQNVQTAQWYNIGTTFQIPIMVQSGCLIRAIINTLTGIPAAGYNAVLNVLYYKLTLN